MSKNILAAFGITLFLKQPPLPGPDCNPLWISMKTVPRRPCALHSLSTSKSSVHYAHLNCLITIKWILSTSTYPQLDMREKEWKSLRLLLLHINYLDDVRQLKGSKRWVWMWLRENGFSVTGKVGYDLLHDIYTWTDHRSFLSGLENKHKQGLLRGKKTSWKKLSRSSLPYRWNILNRTLKLKLWTPLGSSSKTVLEILNRLWRRKKIKSGSWEWTRLNLQSLCCFSWNSLPPCPSLPLPVRSLEAEDFGHSVSWGRHSYRCFPTKRK